MSDDPRPEPNLTSRQREEIRKFLDDEYLLLSPRGRERIRAFVLKLVIAPAGALVLIFPIVGFIWGQAIESGAKNKAYESAQATLSALQVEAVRSAGRATDAAEDAEKAKVRAEALSKDVEKLERFIARRDVEELSGRLESSIDRWDGVIEAFSEGELTEFAQKLGSNEELRTLLRESLGQPTIAPIGTILAFYGEDAPTGWLACDGSPFTRVAYPDLAARLGKLQTPDLRGMFLRGANAGRADKWADPDDREVGSLQDDALEAHRHSTHRTLATSMVNNQRYGLNWSLYLSHVDRGLPPKDLFAVYKNVPGGLHGGDETRPKNVAVLWIIKAR